MCGCVDGVLASVVCPNMIIYMDTNWAQDLVYMCFGGREARLQWALQETKKREGTPEGRSPRGKGSPNKDSDKYLSVIKYRTIL